MVCHGNAFDVVRHMGPRARGRLGQLWPPSTSLLSQYQIDILTPLEHRHRTRKLGYLFKETYIGAERECRWPVKLRNSYSQGGLPSFSRSERRSNCFLSCLFRSSNTIILTFERSENVVRLSGPLACIEGCGLQVRLYLCILDDLNKVS